MSTATWMLIVVGGLIGGFVLLRLGLATMLERAASRLQGQPLPPLPGKAGEQLQGRSQALVYFYSPRCGACAGMTPVLQDLSRRNPGVQLVDISRDMETARAYGIMGTPTLVAARDGVVSEVIVGPVPRPRIEALAG